MDSLAKEKISKRRSSECSNEERLKVKRMGKRVARDSPTQRTSIFKGVTRFFLYCLLFFSFC